MALDDEQLLDEAQPVNVVTFGEQGPPGPPGLGLPLGTTDVGPGNVAIAIAPNVPTWNRSASPGQNTYELPADTTPVPHAISWKNGAAPIVVAPDGWQVWNPVKGELASSYEYVQGPGEEDYDWTASPLDEEIWPR